MSSDEEEVPAAACHEDQEGQRKKKAASKRFENAIEAWLQEYGGLLRHQFETEEQQIGKRARKSTPDFLITDESACLRINGVSLRWLEAKCYCLPCQGEKRKKVMEQAQKYVREGLGPGLVIFSHGYVRCVPHEEGISGLLERGWLFVDWQDRPFELQPWLSPSSGEAQQHLMWEARYRLPSTQETSLRSRSEWKRFPAVLESLPLRAVRKHVKVKEFVEKVMEAVQEELTHKAKTEQRRLTRNTKKKGGEQQQQQQRGSSPPPPGMGCGGSHRSSVKRMVKQKLEPRMVATCNLVRHVADDLIVSWREEHRVDLKLWLLEALRVFLSVKTRASKASAGVLAPEDSPPPMASPISSTVAGLTSALRLEGDEPPEDEGEDKRARRKQQDGCVAKKEGGWAWEDLERAFRLHAAHLAEDLRRQEDMQEDATQVLLSLPKVRDFLQAYCRAVQGDSRGDGSLDGSGHSGRSGGDSQHAGEDRGRRRANDCSSGGGGGRHARCASRSPVSGGGRTSPAGMGPRRGSSGSLRSSGSSSSSSCLPTTPRVPLTLSPSELDSLKLSQLDEVWAGLCGVAQSAGLELDKVLGNRAWVLILEEFRVHKLQSVDRVLRRLNKWLRICTGRISPDSARRRFKALLKALFKSSGSGGGRTLKYQHFTATVLGILSNPTYCNDFERWDAVETSLASLVSTDQRSAFRSLLTDFLHCKHFTQAEIDADKRARWRAGSAASLETSGSSSTGKAMRKANKTKRGWASKGDVLALAVASGYHHEDEEGGAGLSIDAGPSTPHPPSCPCCADLSEGRGTPRTRPHSTSPSLSRSGSMRAMSGSLDGPIAGAASSSSSSKSLPRRPSRSASLSREDLLDVSREDEAMYREERRKEQQQQEKQVLRRAVAPSPPAPKPVAASAVPLARPGTAPPPPPMVPSASMPPMPAMAAPAPQRFSSSALPVMPTLPAPMALPPPPPAPVVGGMVAKGGFVIAQDDEEAEVACEAEEEEDAASSSSESEDEGLDGEEGPEEEGLIWLGAAEEDDDDDLVLLGKQGRPKAQDEEEEGESFVSSFFCDEGVRRDDEDDDDDEEEEGCHHQEGGRRAWAGGQAARAGSTVSDVSTASDDSVPLRLLTSSSSSSSLLTALSSSEGATTPSCEGADGQEKR